MTAAPPTVSVIMAAYNGARLIGETIDSVLSQTFADFELIVVDDCSKDETLDVLRAYDDPRIVVVAAEANRGPVRTRNHAFALARGRYIAGLDQDDICRPERLARQVAFLDAHPKTVLIATAADMLEDGAIRRNSLPERTTPVLIRWLLNLINPLVWSSVMVRGEAARGLEPFTRPEHLFAEDFDLYQRLAPLGTIAQIDDPLLLYRVHGGGASVVHEQRMTASAVAVLTEAYRPIFGDQSRDNAALVLRHLGGGAALPDRAATVRLAEILDRLHGMFCAGITVDPDSAALIARETSALWWKMIRHSVRSGALPLRDALAGRPNAALVREEGRPRDLLVSGLVGRVRAVTNSTHHRNLAPDARTSSSRT